MGRAKLWPVRARVVVHFEDIKAELRKKSSSISKIARALRVHPSSVSKVIRRKRSRRIEQAVANTLSTTPEALWPDRYPKRGGRA